MKLPEVKRLAECQTLADLQAAESALLEGLPLPFEVHGVDEGEQLTHILGAIDVHTRVAQGTPFAQAFREFATRVRDSISS